MNPNLECDHESANTEACIRAAKLNRLSAEQAENCDGGEHRCPYCPWRNPIVTPVQGDKFILKNGKEISIENVNLRHTKHPVIRYRFDNWSRFEGGRATYERKLSDWPKVIEGGTNTRRGAAAAAEGTFTQCYNDPDLERLRAFMLVNPNYKMRAYQALKDQP